MTQTSITIVMPAYNAARTICDAVRSVLAQTCQNFELVICDDCSTDGTGAIVQSFRDPRVRLIRNDKNLGEGPSRDRAIAAACGRWITMLDADDEYAPRRLEKLLVVAEHHPNAVVFDEIMDCHDTPGGLVPFRTVRRPDELAGRPMQVRQVPHAVWVAASRTLVQPFIPIQMIRRFRIHHATIHFAADLAFVLSLLGRSRAPLWYVPEPLYRYRISPNSMSTTNDRHTMLARVMEDALPHFDWNPGMQQAIREKVARTRKDAIYHQFFSALMHARIWRTACAALRHPWVVPEFARRTKERIPYHVSRIRYRGAHRRTC